MGNLILLLKHQVQDPFNHFRTPLEKNFIEVLFAKIQANMIKVLIPILSMSLAQRALLFEHDELNHLNIEFDTQKSKSFTILDRVAREFDEDGSGDDDSNDVVKPTVGTNQVG